MSAALVTHPCPFCNGERNTRPSQLSCGAPDCRDRAAIQESAEMVDQDPVGFLRGCGVPFLPRWGIENVTLPPLSSRETEVEYCEHVLAGDRPPGERSIVINSPSPELHAAKFLLRVAPAITAEGGLIMWVLAPEIEHEYHDRIRRGQSTMEIAERLVRPSLLVVESIKSIRDLEARNWLFGAILHRRIVNGSMSVLTRDNYSSVTTPGQKWIQIPEMAEDDGVIR